MSDSVWSDGPLLPLQGINVLDLSRHLPGPWLTRVLVDLGARVIKVESPNGDPLRHIHPFGGEDNLSTVFATINAGKYSVALNMRTAEGRALLLDMASRVDVLVESYRTGTLAKMGLDEQTLQQQNPRLILCSLTGFGQSGPDATRAGHDINFLARAGLLSQSGPHGAPPPAPFAQIADLAGGSLPGVIGILAALAERERTGRGRRLDISMTRSVAAMGVFSLSRATAGTTEPPGQGMLTGGIPCYRCYRTGDGRYLSVGALEPHFFQRFCDRIGTPELAQNAFATGALAAQTAKAIEDVLATRSGEAWAALFAEEDACVELVRTPEEALPGLEDIIAPINGHHVLSLHVGAPQRRPRPAQKLGADSAVVCRSLGVEDDVLNAALESGALKTR